MTVDLGYQAHPIRSVKDSIGQVNVTGSTVAHVGPKIQADVIILPKATSTKLCSRRKTIVYLSVLLLLALVVAISVCVTLLVPHQTDSTPSGVTLHPQISTPPSLDGVKIVNREMWGGLKVDGQVYVEFQTVSLDNLPGWRCNSTDDCIQTLLNAQQDTPLNYNFLIGDDGKAYEARGWNGLSDFSAPYSTSVVKIGFIGSYQTLPTDSQNNTLYYILQEGIDNMFLSTSYYLMPQCCRGLRNDFGPDEEIYKFYSKSFINACYLFNTNCLTNRGGKTTTFPYTTTERV